MQGDLNMNRQDTQDNTGNEAPVFLLPSSCISCPSMLNSLCLSLPTMPDYGLATPRAADGQFVRSQPPASSAQYQCPQGPVKRVFTETGGAGPDFGAAFGAILQPERRGAPFYGGRWAGASLRRPIQARDCVSPPSEPSGHHL